MKKLAVIIAAVVVVAVAAVLVARHSSKPATSNTTTSDQSTNTNQTSDQASSQDSNNTNSSGCPTPPANTVSYCSGGFNTLTVASGTAVMFKNDSKSEVQIDSDPHPAHTDDTQLNVGLLQPGQSKTVTLTKAGSFGLHNHLMPSERGSITIQ
jgi:hypothetical protein